MCGQPILGAAFRRADLSPSTPQGCQEHKLYFWLPATILALSVQDLFQAQSELHRQPLRQ
jgi:hypothetical protein